MSAGEKKQLRNDMRKIVGNLDPRWIRAASSELNLHLMRLIDLVRDREIRKILAWVPYFPGEVDLSSFIATQLARREIFLPRVHEDRSMKFISLGQNWSETLEPGYSGIPEPGSTSGQLFAFEDSQEAAIIVPGLAFDQMGSRLGRGGGYYDRFLTAHSALNSIIKIGVCWTLQVVTRLPTESHDVRMDYICHERGSFRAGEGGFEDV